MPPPPRPARVVALAIHEEEPPRQPGSGERQEPDGRDGPAREVAVDEDELEGPGDEVLEDDGDAGVAGEGVGERPEADGGVGGVVLGGGG